MMMRKSGKTAVSQAFNWTNVILSVLMETPAHAQIKVLTATYGNARTNANQNETVLNPLNVNAAQFGKVFSLPVGGYINAQPVYGPNVAIPGNGTHNAVYVVTLQNDVYAFDADTQQSALWHLNLGPSVPGSDYQVSDLTEIGILSTPVIDDTTNTIYVVAHSKERGNYIYLLHALDIATGEEKFDGPTIVVGSAPSQNAGSHNGQYSFDASQHLQRPGLLFLNDIVFIAFGSDSDTGNFHRWVVGYNSANI